MNSIKPVPDDDNTQNNSTQHDLYFLILKFLSNGPFQDVYEQLSRRINETPGTLQPCIEWAGQSRQSYVSDMMKEYSHISPDTLLDILKSAQNVVQAGPAPGLITTLGHSSHYFPNLLQSISKEQSAVMVPKPKNVCSWLGNRSQQRPRINLKDEWAMAPKLLNRSLGHLAPIYCVAVDMTGTVAFTGADDSLIKLWSLDTYLLLSTLRGHKKEISDLTINSINTMLASGSCDKEIRVWCLQTCDTLAVLQGHRGTISSISFSPNNTFITTTASDGMVCFWPVLSERSVSDDPLDFYEKVKTSQKLMCSGFSAGGAVFAVGSTDGDVFIYTLLGENGIPVRAETLIGHSDSVMTIDFANHSSSFLSGSKDGTSRIWTRKCGRWEFVVLDARQYPVPNRDQLERVQMTVVEWGCNDSQVFTACTDSTVRVWSCSGELLHTLMGHDEDAYVLQGHPRLPNVLISCGWDGKIITWNTTTGQSVSSTLNVIEGEGRASVHEGIYSPDGMLFVLGDANGHISIYGPKILSGSHNVMSDSQIMSRNQKVPKEQFFNTDYHMVIRDRFSFVLDEQTSMPPHLVGPPYLVDQEGLALPAIDQTLIPGRHILTLDEIKKIRKSAKLKKRAAEKRKKLKDRLTIRQRVISGDRPSTSQASSASGQEIINPELEDFTRSFVAQPSFEVPFSPVVLPTSNYSLTEGILARSLSEIDPSRSQDIWLKRKIVPKLSEEQLRIAQSSQEHMRQSEIEQYNRNKTADEPQLSKRAIAAAKRRCRRARRNSAAVGTTTRSQLVDVISSSEELPVDTSHDSSDSEWSSQRAETNSRQRTTARPVPHSDNSESPESCSPNNSVSGSNTSCMSGTNAADPTSPLVMATRKRRRVKKPRYMSSSDEETIPRKRDERSVEIPSSSLSSDINVKQMDREGARKGKQKCKRDCDKRNSTQEKMKSEEQDPLLHFVEDADDELMCVLETYRPPVWLTVLEPIRSPYLPQVSDQVYYFAQGHKEYLSSVTHTKPAKQPWDYMELEEAQLCKVLSVSFHIGPPTLCAVKLGKLDRKSEDVMDSFQFKYHDSPNISDFMVLKHHYEDSMGRKWAPGDKFRSLIDAKWWEGIVIEETPLDEHFQSSPWRQFTVKWDCDGEIERASPWDIEPLPKDTRSSKRRSPKKKYSEDQGSSAANVTQFGFGTSNRDDGPLDPYILQYYHRSGDWGKETREEAKARISDGISQMMDTIEATDFRYPVSFNDHNDYYCIIAYPIDLGTIHNRLNNDYYRSLDSLYWDIKQIENNARVYNEDESNIVKYATRLSVRLSLFIRNPSTTDIADVTPEDIYRELENRTKSRKRKRSHGKEKAKKTNRLDWYSRAEEVLEQITEHPDSHCFKTPVDLDVYTDYLKYCDKPMDLETITDNLSSGVYTVEEEFYTDIDLIISNSLRYNTRKASQIYKMTIRLKEFYIQVIEDFAQDEIFFEMDPSTPISPSKGTIRVSPQIIIQRSSDSSATRDKPKGKQRVSRSQINSPSPDELMEIQPVVSSEEKENSPEKDTSEESQSTIRATSRRGDRTVKRRRSDSSEPMEENSQSDKLTNGRAGTRRTARVPRAYYSQFDVSSSDEETKTAKPKKRSYTKKVKQQKNIFKDLEEELSQSNGSDSEKENKKTVNGRKKSKKVNGTKAKYTDTTSSHEEEEDEGGGGGEDDEESDSDDSTVENSSDVQSPCKNGKTKSNGKPARQYSDSTNSEQSSTESSSDSSTSNRRRKQRRGKRREKKSTVVTKHGRSVKKNVRYSDFF